MSPLRREFEHSLPPTLADRIDQVCDRFEADWKTGQRPLIEDWLDAAADFERSTLFRELLAVELEFRANAGESPEAKEYRRRFPGYRPEIELVFAPRPTKPGSTAERTMLALTPPARRSGTRGDSDRRYTIVSPHARGGLGEVFLAHDQELNRDVALKQIKECLADDAQSRARFVREAELTGRLEHPGIVPVYGLGRDPDGRPYYAMRFVQGESLREGIDRFHAETPPAQDSGERALWLRQLLRRFVDVCNTVSYAHSRGVLHRDLKPSNVMLGQYGETLVVDWGLAKPLDRIESAESPPSEDLAKLCANDGSEPTRAGSAVGTPAYMSPEQAAGRLEQMGPASDVYSLGATLYHLLTGQVPFENSALVEVLAKVQRGEFPAPRRVQPAVDAALEAICLKAMALEPKNRYESAKTLADDIEHWLADEPVTARRDPPSVRLRRWRRRHRTLVVGMTVASVALLVALGMGNVFVGRQKLRAEANLYRALVGEARAQMQARDTGWWWNVMEDVRQASKLDVAARNSVELRELAIQCIGSKYPCMRLIDRWQGHTGPVTSVSLSPDEQLALSGSRDRTARLWSVRVGRPLAVLEGHDGGVTSVAFHPNGRTVATSSLDGSVRLWDIGSIVDLSKAPTVAVSEATEGDVPTPPPSAVLNLQAQAVNAISFTPDGRSIAAACRDGTVRLISLAEEQPVRFKPPARRGDEPVESRVVGRHTGAVRCLGFSPADPELLASGGEDRTIRLWHSSTGKQVGSFVAENPVTSLDFDRVGNAVFWGDAESYGFYLRDLITNETGAFIQLHTGSVTQVRFGFKTVLTASRDGTVRLWTSAKPGNRVVEVAVGRAEFGSAFCALFTKAQDRVLAGYQDGSIGLWSVAEPEERQFVDGGGQSAAFVGSERRLVNNSVAYDFTHETRPSWKRYGSDLRSALEVQAGGDLFAIGGPEGRIATWERSTRKKGFEWQAHEGKLTALAGSADGSQLASASVDGTVGLWDWRSGQLIRRLRPELGALHALAWEKGGRRLAVSGVLGVIVWDLQGQENPRRLATHDLLQSSVAIGPGAVAHSAPEGRIVIRDLDTGQPRHILQGHNSVVSALAFSAEGKVLASGAAGDGTVRLWDTAAGKELRLLKRKGTSASLLSLDPLNRYLATNTTHETMVWDLRENAPVAEYVITAGDRARFLPDGSGLLLVTKSGSVGVCTIEELDSAAAAVTGLDTRSKLAGAVRLQVATTIVPGGHTDQVWGVAASPDGRWVATASHDQSVKLWDALTMALVRTLEGHGGPVWCVAFSPDSKSLASGSALEHSGQIKLWDVASGRELQNIIAHDLLVTSLAFHPKRPWLASSSRDGTVRLFDLAQRKPVGELHRIGQPVNSLAFRPDGRWLAAGCEDQHVAIWNLDRLSSCPARPDRLLSGHKTPVGAVAFSTQGRYLATGSDPGVIVLWDGDSFERVVTLRGDTGQIRGLSFSRDDNLLAGAAYVSQGVVWNLSALRRTLRRMDLDW
jgi:WD40 repeat protein/serine/threonine protein kinase